MIIRYAAAAAIYICYAAIIYTHAGYYAIKRHAQQYSAYVAMRIMMRAGAACAMQRYAICCLPRQRYAATCRRADGALLPMMSLCRVDSAVEYTR